MPSSTTTRLAPSKQHLQLHVTPTTPTPHQTHHDHSKHHSTNFHNMARPATGALNRETTPTQQKTSINNDTYTGTIQHQFKFTITPQITYPVNTTYITTLLNSKQNTTQH